MKRITEALRSVGIEPATEKAEMIVTYLDMMRGRRDWAGLTSRNLSQDASRVVVESLSVLAATESRTARVVEIGSGGGLLGVVLSIARPEWEVTLVESSGRKAAFLAEVVGALELENVSVINARAQSLPGSVFDVCVSRAAGRLGEMAGVALPLLKPGGKYIALKQSDVAREVEAAEEAVLTLGGRITAVIDSAQQPESVPESVSLVVIEKL